MKYFWDKMARLYLFYS